ncbi:Serralysin C [Defluviimonas aquaemixtae]|uniref:Serralysin C n=1 Tax=Albidovulum aquaemixtae TaxID=1542388 RepID=A0A2R8B2U0_9RHOB|nr:M10 family metallopeptidase C-terminal domain-containing protein [Defluviimonas aquaemixtae]SPH16897.1 Serralysin C [Defluviimonas aquaemixtae]
MATITLRAIHDGGGFTHSSGISDLQVAFVQGQFVLYAASRADGGLSAFTLGAGRAATLLSEVNSSPATGTYGVTDIEITDIGGVPVVAAAGRYDDEFAYRLIGANGSFGTVATISPIPQSTAAFASIEILKFGSQTYMIAGRDNAQGLAVFSMTSGYGLSQAFTLSDSTAATLANVSDLVTFNTGSAHFVFAASSIEHGVTSMSINSSGALSVVDAIDGMKDYGIYQATQLATAEAGDGDFLLVGASGSGNISVFEIGATGDLSLRDMVWDSLQTRYRNVTALEAFDYNGRAFVLAGGSDGGMTLFELGPNGRLYFIANVVDTYTTTLASVSAIEVAIVGGDIQVFVASAIEPGITQFSIDLGAIGNMVTPSGPSNGAVGSPGDDFLVGSDARNTLWGMNGNDRIVDGGGIDTLYGGLGAETFVFVKDGVYDRVMDYQAGIDRIDLSGFDMVYSIAGLDIDSTVYGARVSIGSDAILLVSLDGQPLTAADFDAASFIF